MVPTYGSTIFSSLKTILPYPVVEFGCNINNDLEKQLIASLREKLDYYFFVELSHKNKEEIEISKEIIFHVKDEDAIEHLKELIDSTEDEKTREYLKKHLIKT